MVKVGSNSKSVFAFKPSKLQVLGIVILVFGVMLAYQIGFAFGAGSIFNTTIEAGSMVTESEYIIFKEGLTYYARNGITGAIDYSSSNITSLAEDVIDDGNITFSFSYGTYDFPAILYLPSNVEVYGQGYQTIITSTTLTGEAIFRSLGYDVVTPQTSTAQANITVRDLRFVGLGTGSTVQNGFDFAQCTNVKVLNCYFENFRSYFVKGWSSTNVIVQGNIGEISYGEGFHLVWCVNVVMSDNIARHCYDSAIACGGSQNVVMDSNIVEDTSTDVNPTPHGTGIDISGSRNITVSSNVLNVSGSLYGIMSFWYDNIGYASIRQNIVGNTIAGADYYGIALFGRLNQGIDSQYCNIVDSNMISDSGRHGIFFENTGYSKISNNYVLDSSQETTNTYGGICLDSSASNNQSRIVIDGNYVIDTAANKAAYGIWITSGCYYTVVINNYVRGQVSGYIQDGGIGTTSHNNILNDVWTA